MDEVAERLTNIGREKGRIERKQEFIKNMLLIGRTPNEIAEFCNISINDIENARKTPAHLEAGLKKKVKCMCDVSDNLINNGRLEGKTSYEIDFILELIIKGRNAEEIAGFCNLELSEVEYLTEVILEQTKSGKVEGLMINMMLDNNVPLERIAELCKISLEEVKEIQRIHHKETET